MAARITSGFKFCSLRSSSSSTTSTTTSTTRLGDIRATAGDRNTCVLLKHTGSYSAGTRWGCGLACGMDIFQIPKHSPQRLKFAGISLKVCSKSNCRQVSSSECLKFIDKGLMPPRQKNGICPPPTDPQNPSITRIIQKWLKSDFAHPKESDL